MPDLVTTNAVPQVHAPETRVTPGDIAQPYQELEGLLRRSSEVLNKDVAEPLARQAGLKAVSRNPETGELQMTPAPIVGDAAIEFHKAVKYSALAQGEAEAKRQDLLLSKQFHNDPEGYRVAAEAFKQTHVSEYEKKFGVDVGTTLGRAIDNATTYNYRWLLLEQQRNIKHNFDQATSGQMRNLDNDIDTAIVSGDRGVDVNALINERLHVTNIRATNPILNESSDITKLRVKQFDTMVGAATFASSVREVAEKEGIESAAGKLEVMAARSSPDPSQRAANLDRGYAYLKDRMQKTQMAEHAGNVARKANDDQFEDAVIRDAATGNPTITERDILTSGASPAARMRMLNWQRREQLPETERQVSELTTRNTLARMWLPEGDPNKITNLGEIRDLYANKGTLRLEDEQRLEKIFTQAKSPEGQSIAKAREEFFKRYNAVIDPSLGADPVGAQKSYLALKDAQRQEELLQAQGKDPQSLYDPRSPEFFGNPKSLQRYQGKLDDILKQYQQTPAFTPPNHWQFSPSRQQYRDPQINKIYDRNGREIGDNKPAVPMSH